MRKVLDLH